MQYSIVDSVKSFPEYSGQRGICPCCGSETVAKCGDFKEWHWSHLSLIDCEYSNREMTEWHRSWQEKFPIECREIFMKDSVTGERHFADVYVNEMAIEFQHSPISHDEIWNRINFYTDNHKKKMVWVLDISEKEKIIQKAYKKKEKEILIREEQKRYNPMFKYINEIAATLNLLYKVASKSMYYGEIIAESTGKEFMEELGFHDIFSGERFYEMIESAANEYEKEKRWFFKGLRDKMKYYSKKDSKENAFKLMLIDIIYESYFERDGNFRAKLGHACIQDFIFMQKDSETEYSIIPAEYKTETTQVWENEYTITIKWPQFFRGLFSKLHISINPMFFDCPLVEIYLDSGKSHLFKWNCIFKKHWDKTKLILCGNLISKEDFIDKAKKQID